MNKCFSSLFLNFTLFITIEQKESFLVCPGGSFHALPFSDFQCLFLLRGKSPSSLEIRDPVCFLSCCVHLERCLAHDRPWVPFYSVNKWIMNSPVHWRSKLPRCYGGTDWLLKDEERREIPKAIKRCRLSEKTRKIHRAKGLPFETILPGIRMVKVKDGGLSILFQCYSTV